jgi:uncharacterized protein with HEPN domain
MSFEPRDYLRHILKEADYLLSHSVGLTWDAFAADETKRRAFVRSLEIIGEAAKKLSDRPRALPRSQRPENDDRCPGSQGRP